MALNLYKYFAVEAQGAEEGPPPTKHAKTREGQYLKDHCGHLKHSEVIRDLCSDTTFVASVFPIMSSFAKICRVIPVQTADVERTFSQLKLIKTRTRNRMCEKTLDSLLRIATEGPSPQQYPVEEAVLLWAKKKNRRISV